MKIIDNIDIYVDNYAEFEKFMNTPCNESFDDVPTIDYLFTESYGLESDDKGKIGKLLDVLKKVLRWILNRLKNAWSRLGKIKTKINILLDRDYSKQKGTVIKGIVNPNVLNSLSRYYKLVIASLSEILKDFKLGEFNSDKISKFTENINEHNQNIANLKKPPLDNEVDAANVKNYLTELNKSVQLLQDQRKEVTSLVFEIYNIMDKLSADDSKLSIEYVKNIKNYLNNIFEPMDLHEEAIADSIKSISNTLKKNPSTESVESQIIAAVIEEYGIEGVTSIIRNLSSK